ncbi:hypothetical protein GT037_010986 [Alternaria burnsii]|uniref:Uncharacterized protein n=1 Tax=Alternaria burnsii TaxID=1187904 RepID=A0A8H7EA04_9PLEO|nr:uncharacterized protein GT037_010986 [Alternaria burnsii]KAF7670858.1 hypothetical protein GT037_010986 [Alternaria burnsii]
MFNVVRASDQDKFNDNKCIWCTFPSETTSCLKPSSVVAASRKKNSFKHASSSQKPPTNLTITNVATAGNLTTAAATLEYASDPVITS